ncbi:metalloendopeptidase [Elasticomyces elasticus]|nr:metalloendopeptidase [Elasticomyces elasticus]
MHSRLEYKIVGEEAADDSDASYIRRPDNVVLRVMRSPIWAGSTVVLAFIVGALLVQRSRTGNECPRSTEFGPAFVALEPELVRFSGTANFHENGSAYRVAAPGQPQFVGTPSAEIDAAWDSLITGRYFTITEAEAQRTWGQSFKEYYSNPITGIEMGQNEIRKELDAEHYFTKADLASPFHRYHVAPIPLPRHNPPDNSMPQRPDSGTYKMV